jgi:glycosyltransferase involved in cell wall biosynthesis
VGRPDRGEASGAPQLSVVVPMRDERDTVAAFLAALLAGFAALAVPFEVLVVDASRDGTHERLVAWPDPRVRTLRQRGVGFSAACGEGIAAARGVWVLVMNGDFNHRVEDAVSLWTARGRADLVVGSRFVPGGGSRASQVRHVASRVASRGVGQLARTGLRENFSSFFLARAARLRELPVAELFTGHGEGMLRLVDAALRRGWSVVEVPVVYGRRRAGRSKTRFVPFAWAYLATALRLRARGRRTG